MSAAFDLIQSFSNGLKPNSLVEVNIEYTSRGIVGFTIKGSGQHYNLTNHFDNETLQIWDGKETIPVGWKQYITDVILPLIKEILKGLSPEYSIVIKDVANDIRESTPMLNISAEPRIPPTVQPVQPVQPVEPVEPVEPVQVENVVETQTKSVEPVNTNEEDNNEDTSTEDTAPVDEETKVSEPKRGRGKKE